MFFFSVELTEIIVLIKSTELPWDEPTTGCVEFVKWKSDNSWMTITPWSKLETLALSLLRKILEPDSRKRITVKQIIDHKWCRAVELSGMWCFVFINATFAFCLFSHFYASYLFHSGPLERSI